MSKEASAKKNTHQELKKSHRQLRALALKQQQISEEERRFLSMEIHDDLAPKLTSIQIESAMILKKLMGKSFDSLNIKQITKSIQSINKLADAALESKQMILAKLRLDVLEEWGLLDAAQRYLDEFQKQFNIKYYFYSDWQYLDISYDLSFTLYRILQEALNNCAKHSNATEIDISFEDRNGKLLMTIKDNGKGFTDKEINNSSGLGIVSMGERALVNCDKFSIKGIPGKGTIVKVTAKIEKLSTT